MKLEIAIIGLAFVLLSSCNPLELKPLDVQTVKGNMVTARWFHTSSITTVHNHVELNTNRGWVQLLEADGNGYKIYNVSINTDTVVIQAYKDMLVYQLTSKYWGTHVQLDTSITLFQYMKKFAPENAKYYEGR